MLSGDLERFLHPFAYGDTWNDNDELAPAILLIQLEHRLDITVGFTGPCLHLDIEVDFADFVADELRGNRQILILLDLLQIRQDLCLGDGEIGVFEAFLFLNIGSNCQLPVLVLPIRDPAWINAILYAS